jgi:Kef-type K+ transport system membrane component KefB
MAPIALLLAAASAGFAMARALRLPPLPLLLVAGLCLARFGAVPAEFLEETLVLGVTFLLFVTGTQLNPGHTRGHWDAALKVGAIQFFGLGLAGVAAGLALGWDPTSVGYLALALTASSTVVAVRLLRQRRRLFEPFGRLVVGVLLLQDLLVILLIPVITHAPEGPRAVLLGVLAVGGLLALAWGVWRWVAPRLARLDGDDEAMLLGTLGLLAAFVAVAAWLDLPLLVGAFLAGVALSGFPTSGLIRPLLESIGDFFSAIFYTALGALLGSATGAELLQAIVLAALVILVTPPLVAAIAERSGLTTRPAVEAGLLLAQTSEISLVVGLYGMLEGQIPETAFTVIALATLLTMLFTPVLSTDRVAWALVALRPLRTADAAIPELSGHVVVLGCGATGLPLLETLLGANCGVVVVDEDPVVVDRLRQAQLPVLRGDAGQTDVLRRSHARSARIITSTIRRPDDILRVLEYVRGVPVIARVFEREDAERIRARGGTPVLYSEAAAESLLEWVERNLDSAPPVG